MPSAINREPIPAAPGARNLPVRLKALGALFAVLALTGTPAFALSVGDRFPSLVLPDSESGASVDVGEKFGGKVGVLVFMQTTCSVCKAELETLKKLSAGNDKMEVVAVSVDAGEPDRVVRFKKEKGFTFTFLHDPEFIKPGEFGFRFTPGLVLTGKDGIITLLKSGFRPEDEKALQTRIGELISR